MLHDPKAEKEYRTRPRKRRSPAQHNATLAETPNGVAVLQPRGVQPAATQAEPSKTVAASVREVRLIAFYLPQFHPVAENDQAWGKGFTEWTCVAAAKPYFLDHKQPKLPADLGFYDLRLSEVRDQQALLAREYGIYGFCYHYYWFSGRRVLERPLQEVLTSGKPDFPFCICWANETWSRRWDGSEHEVLITQRHDPDTDKLLILDLLSLLQDPRYIRIDDAPLIVIYRVSLLPQPRELFAAWRETAAKHGLPRLHISMAETFGLENPYAYGCDSAVEFPPHGLDAPVMNAEVPGLAADYAGYIYDYRDIVAAEINRRKPPYLRFRGVMPGWDNTPRRGSSGNAFINASPELYETWLRAAIEQASHRPSGERLVFINAWNEWGEGAHLEPDRWTGRSYLEATRRACFEQSGWREILLHLESLKLDSPDCASIVRSLRSRFMSLEIANRFLSDQVERHVQFSEDVTLRPERPEPEISVETTSARGFVDSVNRFDPAKEKPVIFHESPVLIKGWCYLPGNKQTADSPLIISLRKEGDGVVYSGIVRQRLERRDVVEHFDCKPDEARWSGFLMTANVSSLTPGNYRLGLAIPMSERLFRFDLPNDIIVV